MPPTGQSVFVVRDYVESIEFDYEHGETLIKISSHPELLILGAHVELSEFAGHLSYGKKSVLRFTIQHGIIVDVDLT